MNDPFELQPFVDAQDAATTGRIWAVERGQSFTVTRGGHEIGELAPLARRRRFVSGAEFAKTSRAVTLAELSAGVHLVRGDDSKARAELARRTDVLQRLNDFDPIAFDAHAARAFGRISAAVQDAGRMPRRRVADLMIASVAAAQGLPLYRTNRHDFAGLGGMVDVVPVMCPDLAGAEGSLQGGGHGWHQGDSSTYSQAPGLATARMATSLGASQQDEWANS